MTGEIRPLEVIKMQPSCLIPFHVPSYDGVAALQTDTTRLVDETWCALLAWRSDVAAPSYVSILASQVIDSNGETYHRLSHPLSNSALERAGGKPSREKLAQTLSIISKRNIAERAALNILYADIDVAICSANADVFVTCLERIVSHLLESSTRIRTASSIILPDPKGVGWQCVPVHEVLRRLQELHRYIVARANESPLQTAMVALVMISCIHPFVDGNGRVSRVIFHAILRRYGVSPKFYIPLKNFYVQSDFGFEIRLRQTFLTSDWHQITHYFCDVLHAFLH